jgi:hypothetical protein
MANSKQLTNEQIGAEAAKIARRKVLEQARAVKLSTKRILQRISEGLDAVDNKVFYDKDRGRCIVGPDQVDHGRRLEAAGMGIMIHEMKPCEKKKVDLNVKGALNINIIDRFGADDQSKAGKKTQQKAKQGACS